MAYILYWKIWPKSKKKKKKKPSRTISNIQPEEKGEEVNSLDDFINWINDDQERQDIFAGTDWDFYRAKKNWISSLKKWNALRTDRLDLLTEWHND